MVYLLPSLPVQGGIHPKIMVIQKIVYDDYNSSVRSDQSTMTTLTTNCGASALRNGVKIIEIAAQNKSTVKVKQATKQGYIECELGGSADLNYPNSNTRRGRVIEQGRICPTLTTTCNPYVLEKFIYEIDGELYLVRIRKLTPLECWRLMGFSDTDFNKAASVNSNTQLYKQPGNRIVKQVLMSVFSQMIPTQSRVNTLQRKALALLDP